MRVKTTLVLAAISAVLLLNLQVSGQKFHDEDDEEYIRYFLNQQFLDSELYHKALDEVTTSLKGHFPVLTPKQKQFAVNPSFKSFYDSRYREIENIDEYRNSKALEDAEVVASDPIAPEEPVIPLEAAIPHNQVPKKASLEALEGGRVAPLAQRIDTDRIDDIYFTTIVAVSSALAVFAVVGAGFCYYRVQRNSKASEDVEYPAYGVTGPGKETSPTAGGDRKLAQSAQMYHYQHQKQQMIAFDSANGSTGQPERRNGAASDCESDDGEEGDYTVYECPGLAPTGEMEVRNPLFQDDPTPKAQGNGNGNGNGTHR